MNQSVKHMSNVENTRTTRAKATSMSNESSRTSFIIEVGNNGASPPHAMESSTRDLWVQAGGYGRLGTLQWTTMGLIPIKQTQKRVNKESIAEIPIGRLVYYWCRRFLELLLVRLWTALGGGYAERGRRYLLLLVILCHGLLHRRDFFCRFVNSDHSRDVNFMNFSGFHLKIGRGDERNSVCAMVQVFQLRKTKHT